MRITSLTLTPHPALPLSSQFVKPNTIHHIHIQQSVLLLLLIVTCMLPPPILGNILKYILMKIGKGMVHHNRPELAVPMLPWHSVQPPVDRPGDNV